MTALDRLSSDPRIKVRRRGQPDAFGNCVVCWMQRSQRAVDNAALELAVRLGNELGKPVVVFFAPVPFYPGANQRNLRFLAEGVADIAEGLARRGVGFCFRAYPEHSLLKFCEQVRPAMVVGDENPLREPKEWRQRVAGRLLIPFWSVDADVVVPSRLLEKEHYGARTIRPRLLELLPKFLQQPEKTQAHIAWTMTPGLRSQSWEDDFTRDWALDRTVSCVNGWRGGTTEAMRRLSEFVQSKLAAYPEGRNRPETDSTSRLSPYLHFGHIGPNSVAWAIRDAEAPEPAKHAFLEQLIVRRELAINFVRFNSSYDSVECMEPWADRSFAQHTSDRRPILYSPERLDNAETHDPLWNAAQKQMVLTGWMHNYLRMYWAKKILEWSPSVASAYQRAIWLNDRYELDGRDPNGYAGIAWAIVGKHDRPWFDRPVFGQVRYMSLASTGRKFDAKRYIGEVERLERSYA
ncbi:MAG TPA: deoxyribodipyrimidine photo-lyase [Candidatus Sulfotelmatobacter sp.]|nr:deoxyribodipyrimidine photo-lyase [Candidatus Sulfotelmatobacter sp.]